MNATALAAWLAIPQEDRDGVVTLLRTRADAGERANRVVEAVAAKATSAARRVVRQKARDAERVNRACAAAADLLAAAESDASAAPTIDLAAPLDALDLSVRAERLLLLAGISGVRDLTSRTRADLLKIRGFGRGCFSEVETALAAHGLRLAGGEA